MGHKVFRDAITGKYVSRHEASANPDTTVAETISGELRKIVLVDAGGAVATDYVPVEHLDEYTATAVSNGWKPVHVGDSHDSGPGGDDQHYHDED